MSHFFSLPALGGSIFILFIFFWFFCIAFSIAITIFGILMIIDCAKRKFPKGKEDEKIIWLLVIILASWIGALLYYFMVKKKKAI